MLNRKYEWSPDYSISAFLWLTSINFFAFASLVYCEIQLKYVECIQKRLIDTIIEKWRIRNGPLKYQR